MAGGGGAEVRKAGGAASACARGERSTRGPLQSQRVREGEGGRGGEGEANRHGERWHRNARVLRLARPRERAQRRSHRRVRTELLPQHPVHHEGVAIAPSRQELVHAVRSRSERVRLNKQYNERNNSMSTRSDAAHLVHVEQRHHKFVRPVENGLILVQVNKDRRLCDGKGWRGRDGWRERDG